MLCHLVSTLPSVNEHAFSCRAASHICAGMGEAAGARMWSATRVEIQFHSTDAGVRMGNRPLQQASCETSSEQGRRLVFGQSAFCRLALA